MFSQSSKKRGARTYTAADFARELSFTPEQIEVLRKSYLRYAFQEDLMDKSRFRLSMGILGMDNAGFLADRLFDLMDSDRDGIIHLMDFLKYLDITMNRDPYEKAKLSFRFIDSQNKGSITYEDIRALIGQVALFWKDLTGSTVVPMKSHIDEIFGALDVRNTGAVLLSDFYKAYYASDCYFQWFELFNQDQANPTSTKKMQEEHERIEHTRQRDLLLRLEIENTLTSMQQELTQLVVRLTKLAAVYKDKQQQKLNEEKKQKEVAFNTVQIELRKQAEKQKHHTVGSSNSHHSQQYPSKFNQQQEQLQQQQQKRSLLVGIESNSHRSMIKQSSQQTQQKSQQQVHPSIDFSTATTQPKQLTIPSLLALNQAQLNQQQPVVRRSLLEGKVSKSSTNRSNPFLLQPANGRQNGETSQRAFQFESATQNQVNNMDVAVKQPFQQQQQQQIYQQQQQQQQQSQQQQHLRWENANSTGFSRNSIDNKRNSRQQNSSSIFSLSFFDQCSTSVPQQQQQLTSFSPSPKLNLSMSALQQAQGMPSPSAASSSATTPRRRFKIFENIPINPALQPNNNNNKQLIQQQQQQQPLSSSRQRTLSNNLIINNSKVISPYSSAFAQQQIQTSSQNSSLNFGSLTEINNNSALGESGVLLTSKQSPIEFISDASAVSGPFLLNVPSDRNPGDNDPETEDEDDCNNDRAYLQAKFKMMQQAKKKPQSNEIQLLQQSKLNQKGKQSYESDDDDDDDSNSINSSVSGLNSNMNIHKNNIYDGDDGDVDQADLDSISSEFKQVEQKIQFYIQQIEDFQNQLAELEDAVLDQNQSPKLKQQQQQQQSQVKWFSTTPDREKYLTDLQQYSSTQSQVQSPSTERKRNSVLLRGADNRSNSGGPGAMISEQKQRKNTMKNMPILLEKEQQNPIKAASSQRQLSLYIGHENWNVMLQIMLVIRSAIKSLRKLNPRALQANLFNTSTSNNNNNSTPIAMAAVQVVANPVLEIRPKDFETQTYQLLFPSTSGSNEELQQYEYVDYCPLVFESLRGLCGITQETILRALGPENLIGNLIMGRMSHISDLCLSSGLANGSAASSSSSSSQKSSSSSESELKFQYYSECGRFIIKTIPEKRALQFLKMLPTYYSHIATQPDSLLIRILGLYKLQIREDANKKKKKQRLSDTSMLSLNGEAVGAATGVASGSGSGSNGGTGKLPQRRNVLAKHPIYFVVCNNIFDTDLEVKHKFQLKGSTRGRKAVKKNMPFPNASIPKKDLDWIDEKFRIRVSMSVKQQVLAQLHRDCAFLASHAVINYCLLVGIHDYLGNGEEATLNMKERVSNRLSKLVSVDKKTMYLLGAINIFTEFTLSKKWVAMLKNPFLGKTQSTVDPATYASRLHSFFAINVLE